MAVMNMKREQFEQIKSEFVKLGNQESGETSEWSTPLKSFICKVEKNECVDVIKAPVKAERKLVRDLTEEEQCGGLLQTPDSVSDFTASPLRSCPKFDSIIHDRNDETCSDRNGGVLKNHLPVDCGQSARSNPENSLNFDEEITEIASGYRSSCRVDFSGGELADHYEDMEDDTCITGSTCIVINNRCPLSGKLVTELEDPVQSVDCHHVYGEAYAKAYLNQSSGSPRCAVAGCRGFLKESDLTPASSLTESIQNLREKESADRLKLLMECIRLDDD
ncbi:hypothetical protein R1sor_013115 [Riccia sorocarpa]|uniref:SP-RING-type domain-containing protein n=1 Tax=Riccia sorocarpa TaxID=122646 RepID=A0ABD3H7L5_9MARC